MALPKTPEELMERIEKLEVKINRLSDEDCTELITLKETLKEKAKDQGTTFSKFWNSLFYGKDDDE